MDLSPENADRAGARAAELVDLRLKGDDTAMLAAIQSVNGAEAKEMVVALVTTRAAEIKRAAAGPLN